MNLEKPLIERWKEQGYLIKFIKQDLEKLFDEEKEKVKFDYRSMGELEILCSKILGDKNKE